MLHPGFHQELRIELVRHDVLREAVRQDVEELVVLECRRPRHGHCHAVAVAHMAQEADSPAGKEPRKTGCRGTIEQRLHETI
jgi:hypothetical protein